MNIEDIPPKYYVLDEFKFENGEVLENQKVEYITLGTPQYDDEGFITNAVIYFHGTSGNYGSIRRISEELGENRAFDTDKLFFISLSTLGTPGSCSPSTSNMGRNFPEYTIADMVNFNKQFIMECLNVKHLRGVIGNSMGGFEAVMWACMYPDDMDFLISLVSSYKVGGQNYVLSKLMYDVIVSDPNFECDENIDELKRSLIISSKAMYSFGLSRQFYMDQPVEDIAKYMDEFAYEDAQEDVFDAFYRCVASMNYDLTDCVENIKVKTLIIGIYEDQYFPPEFDAIPMHAKIKDSRLICYNSYLGHVGSSELSKIHNELEDFMSEFKY